jgi:hypothetical protein
MKLRSWLNRFVPRFPQPLPLLYDLDEFGGQLFVDITWDAPSDFT